MKATKRDSRGKNLSSTFFIWKFKNYIPYQQRNLDVSKFHNDLRTLTCRHSATINIGALDLSHLFFWFSKDNIFFFDNLILNILKIWHFGQIIRLNSDSAKKNTLRSVLPILPYCLMLYSFSLSLNIKNINKYLLKVHTVSGFAKSSFISFSILTQVVFK